MGVIDKAVEWVKGVANDSSHGYDQTNRWGPDYDCASLVITAYQKAGTKVKTNGATYTGNMVSAFKKSGFKDVTSSVNLVTGEGLKKGDVLWRRTGSKGHTAMMVTRNKIVEATSNENSSATGGQTGDQTGKEIYIRSWYAPSNPWLKCLRYKKESTTGDDENLISSSDVISKNEYLTTNEMKKNAQYILNYLVERGWTKEAVCGMLGNMQTESTINPGIWQSLKENNLDGGFGLVQWTPATKLINWADDNNLNYKKINTQLKRIIWEVENGVQFYSTDDYPLSFKEFITSTKSPEYLARAFLHNYERPASYDTENTREEQARYWYDLLVVGKNVGDEEDGEPTYSGDRKSHVLSKMLLYAGTDRF